MPALQLPFVVLACLGSLAAFVGAAPPALSPARPSAAADAGVALTEARDLNADDSILEINLNARIAAVDIAPSKRVSPWTYDRGLPGPLIRARVGTRLVVHFTNDLPKPTTVHWHGVRVPIEMGRRPGHVPAGSTARRLVHV